MCGLVLSEHDEFDCIYCWWKMFFLICWVKCLDLNVVLIVFSSETGVRVLKLGHLNESDGA